MTFVMWLGRSHKDLNHGWRRVLFWWWSWRSVWIGTIDLGVIREWWKCVRSRKFWCLSQWWDIGWVGGVWRCRVPPRPSLVHFNHLCVQLPHLLLHSSHIVHLNRFCRVHNTGVRFLSYILSFERVLYGWVFRISNQLTICLCTHTFGQQLGEWLGFKRFG